MRFAISECAVSLAVSALTGNILILTILILMFRALTRKSWFDMVSGIPVEAQLGIFRREKCLRGDGCKPQRSQTSQLLQYM